MARWRGRRVIATPTIPRKRRLQPWLLKMKRFVYEGEKGMILEERDNHDRTTEYLEYLGMGEYIELLKEVK